MTNTWSLYREIRELLLGQLESLSVEQTEMMVPLCPQWRVVDVVSHVCGLNADLVGGMRVGLGIEENTARQVADRTGHTLAQVAAEWRGYGDRIEELYAEIPGIGAALVADLVMHVHDVQHALGLEIDREGPGVAQAAARYVDVLKARVAEHLGVEIEINLIDGEPATGGSADLRLDATSYDFLRSIGTRRSRGQIEALDWTGDPTAVLDGAWQVYGDFPAADVSV
jgi:uncharacterized protein (TIGR03083 family)